MNKNPERAKRLFVQHTNVSVGNLLLEQIRSAGNFFRDSVMSVQKANNDDPQNIGRGKNETK